MSYSITNTIQRVTKSQAIRDTRLVKLGQSCAMWYLLKMNSKYFRIYTVKTKFWRFCFIFFLALFKGCSKNNLTLLKPLSRFYKMVLLYFQSALPFQTSRSFFNFFFLNTNLYLISLFL